MQSGQHPQPECRTESGAPMESSRLPHESDENTAPGLASGSTHFLLKRDYLAAGSIHLRTRLDCTREGRHGCGRRQGRSLAG